MKKTLIALMALAGVATADEYIGTFDGKTFIFSNGPITLENIQCSPDDYKTPTYLGDNVGTETTYIAPNINMNAGSWTISCKVKNNSDIAITLGSVTLDAFMFTGAGIQHEDDGKVRDVSFTLGGDFDGSVVETFTGKDNEVKFRNTDTDATISFTAPVTIDAGKDVSFTLTVANGGENGGSFVGLKGATFTSVTIPEPATATLSLLALAGLAARRRR